MSVLLILEMLATAATDGVHAVSVPHGALPLGPTVTMQDARHMPSGKGKILRTGRPSIVGVAERQAGLNPDKA